MSTFNAFEMSPVPTPSKDAQPPEPFHGIYGMPMFVTVPTSDLSFWCRPRRIPPRPLAPR